MPLARPQDFNFDATEAKATCLEECMKAARVNLRFTRR
jgi:hypothetical protein